MNREDILLNPFRLCIDQIFFNYKNKIMQLKHVGSIQKANPADIPE